MTAKNILLLTASIGAGHTKAAEAIAEALRALPVAYNIETLDWSDKNVSFANYFTKNLYLNMLALVPNLYDVFYKLSASTAGNRMAQNLNEGLMRTVMERLTEQYKPHAVICTHPFPAGAAAAVKRHGGKFLLATVATDYTLHKMWVNHETDLFFVATEAMRRELLADGFAPTDVASCGIPIRRTFAKNAPNTENASQNLDPAAQKKAARQLLVVADNEPMILLMGGGLGLGGIENTVRALNERSEHFVIFVLAGKNEKLRRRLSNYAYAKCNPPKVIGFTENTATYMQAADLIVTKPGALTLSESFALGLPQILHEPIPGPETQNARYAVENGAALWATDNIGDLISNLLHDRAKLQQMQQAARKLARPHAAAVIAEKIAERLA